MFEELQSTQSALNFLVKLGQCLLLMPVSTISHNLYNFRWSSKKSIAAMIISGVSFIKLALFLNYFFHQPKKFSATTGVVFYLTTFLFKIQFVSVAQKWPNLMKRWAEVDSIMQPYLVIENFGFKIKVVSILLFSLALGEHLFFTASLGIFTNDLPWSVKLETYFKEIFQFVFMVLPYNFYFAVLVQVFNWSWTIIWNYVDVFIISLCICFTYRLKQIESKIDFLVKLRVRDVTYWKQTRENYNKLSELCSELEKSVSPLVLVSFADKFYTVLYQLLGLLDGPEYGLEQDTKIISKLYYAFSFCYILLRFSAVIFFASAIDVKNKDIASKLFETPSEVYNFEIERFIMHLKVSPPIITGAKIFQIKKSLLLKIISAIIIYELVVIKFQKY